jgi:urease accessory protein
MLTIDRVIGNIHRDDHLCSLFKEFVLKQQDETFLITRTESLRQRLRKVSSKGTDVALNFHSGNQHMRQGDVLFLNDKKIIVVEIEPENVLQVEILKETLDDNKEHLIQTLVQIGHTVGNLHRPIKFNGSKIYFPIQSESEVEMFRKLFRPYHHQIKIQSTKIVFEPNEFMNVDEH